MDYTDHLIQQCLLGDRTAQKELFQRYAPHLLAVCMRYLPQRDEAEDALTEGFVKIFEKMNTYSGQGSFEGWMKKVVVNECLMILRQKKRQPLTTDANDVQLAMEPKSLQKLISDDILNLLRLLPDGYRTIFSLYVLDGYKHREIAEILGISINTSKSQLILARKKMIELLRQTNQNP